MRQILRIGDLIQTTHHYVWLMAANDCLICRGMCTVGISSLVDTSEQQYFYKIEIMPS